MKKTNKKIQIEFTNYEKQCFLNVYHLCKSVMKMMEDENCKATKIEGVDYNLVKETAENVIRVCDIEELQEAFDFDESGSEEQQ